MSPSNPNPTNQNPNPTGAAPTATPPVITSMTDTNSTKTKVSIETRYQTLIAGILANLMDVTAFVLPTGTFTQSEIVAEIHRRIAAAEETKSTKTAWHTAVQVERQVDADLRPLRKGLQQYVASRYGADSAKMAEFGFTPAKARKTKVSIKAGAADKAVATRKARHTMGKQQKKPIKGAAPTAAATVPATAVATVPATPAGAVPATTAPPSPTGGTK
jgi:hypothetical protein